MHLSDVEKARMEKEHRMRNGYQDTDDKRFPHNTHDITEHQHVYEDMDNRHARATNDADRQKMMEAYR